MSARDDGPVAGAVTGVVRSGDTPLGDAVLTLTDGAGTQVGRIAQTPGGHFGFDAVAPGRYVLIAHHCGHRPRALTVRVAAGQPTMPLAVALEPIAGVRGVVRDPDTGAPVAAATVVALDAGGDVVATTMSDPDGTYRLGGVGAAITLVVAAPGADPVARGIDRDAGPDGSDQVVDLPVRTRGSLAGTVSGPGPAAGLGLVLLDPTGRAVAATTTGGDGGYRFGAVPAGVYTLRSDTRAAVATVAVGPHEEPPDLVLS
ncbi:MSCRAMM family protein [Pseudonocardia sp.]|uniref:MSCRAMM family protein n=2 Tax=Pseudonocardia sp. TaxID=60912 RepID=UPI003D0BCC6F